MHGSILQLGRCINTAVRMTTCAQGREYIAWCDVINYEQGCHCVYLSPLYPRESTHTHMRRYYLETDQKKRIMPGAIIQPCRQRYP
jgi:hypothetical protein